MKNDTRNLDKTHLQNESIISKLEKVTFAEY